MRLSRWALGKTFGLYEIVSIVKDTVSLGESTATFGGLRIQSHWQADRRLLHALKSLICYYDS